MFTRKNRNLKKGASLIEAMISAGIMALVLTAAASTIISTRLLSSYARHKQQAASVAQQLLEQKRRLAFSAISSVPSAAVTLDTKGTYATTADDFLGNAIVTVTAIDAYKKNVLIEINWQERLTTGRQVTMREHFATIIGNDNQLK